MTEELFKKIDDRYIKSGFKLEEKTEYYAKYHNRFSVHFIFISENLEEAKRNLGSYLGIVDEDYLKGKSQFYIEWPDIFWNFYVILIINISEDENFIAFKELIEGDIRRCRKYVITHNDLDSLPPSFWKGDENRYVKVDQLWESEWKKVIGEELYDKIMDSPKSKIEDILWRYVNDTISKIK